MKRFGFAFLVLGLAICSTGQSANSGDFDLALPDHKGQLHLHANGFETTELSAKPGGQELGIRGKNPSTNVTFLTFLFLVPDQAPMVSAKCRDGAMESLEKSNPGIKISASSVSPRADGPSVEIVNYTVPGQGGKVLYDVRAFVASGDICGDLEIYSETPIRSDDPQLRQILESYRLDLDHVPGFRDQLFYASVLYHKNMYKAAGPMFEEALASLKSGDPEYLLMRRVVTDQAVMSYGMSDDIPKVRALAQNAIAQDPDYPLNYYNLACADAEENKLKDAKAHLRQAFDRKGNVNRGESMPDPMKDDSFLPHRTDKEFWGFVESLH